MDNLSKRALIMTVGLPGDQGGDVLDALKLDLDALQPAFLILIASGQSMNNARRMLERSGLSADATEIVELVSAHDMDEAFHECNGAIQRLIAHGFAPDQIAINYTSGTKVMGSGAVLSAVYNKIMELRYITGLAATRENDRSRHRILTTQPAGVFAYHDLIESIKMTHDLRFQSARRSLERIAVNFLSPEDLQVHQELTQLAAAYEDWDNFYPDRFLQIYTAATFQAEALEPYRLGADQLEAVAQLVEERKRQEPGPLIIADLYNNAARRLMAGRPEDAFARLYRALEMLAQWVLKREFGIDTNDVETRKIPPRDRIAYEAMRSLDDGMVKIGLRKAFELLVILRTQVGIQFQHDGVVRGLLEKRAGSILAHGYTSADPAIAQDFILHTRDLFRIEIPDFDALTLKLQFPWVIDRLPE